MKYPWIRLIFTLVFTVISGWGALLISRFFAQGVPSGLREGLALVFVWGAEILLILIVLGTIGIAKKIPAPVGLGLMAVNAVLFAFLLILFPKTL